MTLVVWYTAFSPPSLHRVMLYRDISPVHTLGGRYSTIDVRFGLGYGEFELFVRTSNTQPMVHPQHGRRAVAQATLTVTDGRLRRQTVTRLLLFGILAWSKTRCSRCIRTARVMGTSCSIPALLTTPQPELTHFQDALEEIVKTAVSPLSYRDYEHV
ncbi:hypothetical protein BKA83DRAFT_1977295 [Pisolithus microcarpus]|nr:hypothetical protein BKA83DRAFT_1977295 [Pisolithus microcarpus]